jgi:hypothetical protein
LVNRDLVNRDLVSRDLELNKDMVNRDLVNRDLELNKDMVKVLRDWVLKEFSLRHLSLLRYLREWRNLSSFTRRLCPLRGLKFSP